MKNILIVLFLMPILMTQSSWSQAEEPQHQFVRVSISDVILSDSGQLKGFAATDWELPLSLTEVILSQNGKRVTSVITDKNGYFEIPQLTAGLYELQIGWKRHAVRVWTAQHAPPSVSSQLVTISGDPRFVQTALSQQHPRPAPQILKPDNAKPLGSAADRENEETIIR